MAIWDFTMSKYMIASRAYHYTNRRSEQCISYIYIGRYKSDPTHVLKEQPMELKKI